MRVFRLPAVVAALALASGCYTYQPIGAPRPAAGTQVSAELTEMGTASLGRLLGAGAVEVRGRLTDVTDSSITLVAEAVRLRSGVETFWQGERVTLQRALVARLSERRFSRRRSLLAGGALTAAAPVAAAVIGGLGGGSAPPGGGGPGPR